MVNKMPILTLILALVLVLALLLGTVGAALATGDVVLRQWVLGGGASDSAAGDVALQATLGEPVVGDISGAEISIGQGFWHRGAVYQVYLPLVVRSGR